MSTLWLVMRMQTVASFRSEGFPFFCFEPSDEPGQPVGYLPVFDTREAAEEWADDDKYAIVRVETKEEQWH